jgi:CRP-like cAMP-binding protein
LAEGLALNDSRARLIRRLLKTAAPDEARDGRWTVRISQEEIARDIGAARETVARQLSSLRRSKLIATGPRRIFLIDRPALQKLI